MAAVLIVFISAALAVLMSAWLGGRAAEANGGCFGLFVTWKFVPFFFLLWIGIFTLISGGW